MYMDGIDHSFKETDEAAVILNTMGQIGFWMLDVWSDHRAMIYILYTKRDISTNYAIVHDPFFFDNMQNIFINRNKKLL